MRGKIVDCVAVAGLVLGLLCLPSHAMAQRAAAVPRLDLHRYMGQWYVISRIPTKAEKRCLSDNLVLYAIGERPRSFQMGTFCTVKGGNPDDLNASGTMDKRGTGALKLSHLVLFSRKYWVLATGADYDWALVGSPNHKTLWVLSRAVTLSPESRAEIEKAASAQGFNPGRLIPVVRTVSEAQTSADPVSAR